MAYKTPQFREKQREFLLRSGKDRIADYTAVKVF